MTDLPGTSSNLRVWLEIDLKAVRSNFRQIKNTLAPAQVMVVLKADAYGLGEIPVARALVDEGADRVGIAAFIEAERIKRWVAVPLQILGGIFPWEIPPAVAAGVVCPVDSIETARALSLEAIKQGKKCTVHFLIDTGMGRLGIPHERAVEEVNQCLELEGLEFEGFYSHLANANNPEHPKTQEQLAIFNRLLQNWPNRFRLIHIANSDGINNFPESSFNMVRTGINLYGVFDLLGGRRYNLKPSLTLKSRLISKRLLPAGHSVGYGCTYILDSETWVGTVPAGYADGIPYHLQGRAEVLIKGRRYPLIGRVSMDYITLNLGRSSSVEVGDEVVIFGQSGEEGITVEDWARLKETHPYDIICSLGKRVRRVYVGENHAS